MRVRWMTLAGVVGGLLLLAALVVLRRSPSRPEPPAPAPVVRPVAIIPGASAGDAPGTLTGSGSLEQGGARVTGAVLDSGGGPIPGARVSAFAADDPGKVLATTTGPDGAFALALPTQEMVMVAAAAGYAPARRLLRAGVDRQTIFRLDPGALISGRVVERGSARPVSGAEIEVTSTTGAGSAGDLTALTDASGAFRLPHVAPGGYRIWARRDALVGSSQAFELDSAGMQDVVVEVAPGRVLSGRVLGEAKSQGKRPVGGASLRIERQAEGPSPVVVTTSLDGHFLAVGLLPDRYDLQVRASGFAPARSKVDLRGADRSDLEVVLGTGAELAGRVVDQEGRAVAAARVLLIVTSAAASLRDVRAELDTTTGSDGRFSLAAVPAGHAHLTASTQQGGRGTVPTFVVGNGRSDLEVVLRAPGSLAGQVHWKTGGPAAGVRVTAVGPAGSAKETVTRDDGTFSLTGLAAGQTHVMAAAGGPAYFAGAPMDQGAQQLVTVRAGEVVGGMRFTIRRTDHQISGLVTDGAGQPLAGAVVTGSARTGTVQARATSGADGTFVLVSLADGLYDVQAKLGDRPETVVRGVAAGSTNLELRIESGGIITGRIVAQGRAVAASYSAAAVPHGSSVLGAPSRQEVSRLDEPFTLRGLQAGLYDLQILTSDGRAGTSERIEVKDGQQQRVEVSLRAAVALSGKVVDHLSGAPLAGLSVMGFSPWRPIEVSTAEDGTFTVEGLPPGRALTLAVGGQGFLSEEIQASLPADASEETLPTIRLVRKSALPSDGASVGISAVNRHGQLAVDKIDSGSAAERAGVRPGDRLLALEGQNLDGLGARALSVLLRGPPGTVVNLRILSPGQPARVLTLARGPAPGRGG